MIHPGRGGGAGRGGIVDRAPLWRVSAARIVIRWGKAAGLGLCNPPRARQKIEHLRPGPVQVPFQQLALQAVHKLPPARPSLSLVQEELHSLQVKIWAVADGGVKNGGR